MYKLQQTEGFSTQTMKGGEDGGVWGPVVPLHHVSPRAVQAQPGVRVAEQQ